MELDIWIFEGLLIMAIAFMLAYIVAWFISRFNRDE